MSLQAERMADAVPSTPALQASRIKAAIAGTRLEVLDTGADRLRTLLALIGGAQHSIRLLFYMFSGDEAGAAVRDALTEAAARGVAVKLVVDGFGSNVTPAFFEGLRDHGGEACLFHPRYGRRYLLRNHQKLVVVDDARAIIGGANINKEYLSDGRPEDWRDLWLLVEGPAVPPAGRYFDAVHRWTATDGAKMRALRRIIRRHSQHQGPLQWRYSGPMSRSNLWTRPIMGEIASGRSLHLISAYFSPPFAMLRRIARLGRRGSVRIITAAKSDNNATIAAARHTYARLLRAGVEMYEYQPAKLHTKLVMVDDIVYIGSSNFDFRSLYMNLEVMLRIEDRGFAAQMRRYFDGELEQSQPITPEFHRRRATWLRRMKWTVSHWLVTAVDYTVNRRLNFGAER